MRSLPTDPFSLQQLLSHSHCRFTINNCFLPTISLFLGEVNLKFSFYFMNRICVYGLSVSILNVFLQN
ncbi:transmembrane protein, putative [Medicago truncatula]|uniref:Transmembrane protein, putative n=1 Tax=Medicago truncatula TaxID=3880 RepID=G7I6R1_MEDTR|nr:transmembrane protein, putative [Medicago truncatula]